MMQAGAIRHHVTRRGAGQLAAVPARGEGGERA